MNYYVRRTDESGIEGPFTVEQINQMFKDKLLDLNSTGLADTGQDIHDIKDFYERAVITNNISSSSISNWTSGVEVVQQATASALGDDTNLIVFVHGFNVDNVNWLIDSDTVFKRLYWAGYQGKFASADWPCGKVSLNPYAFNTSEVNAYKASTSLKTYLNQLRTRFPNYRLDILAHSQGNAVVSEAIKQGAPFDNYILTQGAIPASCLDAGAPVDETIASYDTGSNITPEWQPMGYRGVYTNFTGRIVNYYNQVDFALATGTTLFGLLPVNWVQNQKLDKPSYYYSYDGTNCWYEDFFYIDHLITDTEETRANVSRSRTDAVGATAGLGGVIQSSVDLQAQFGFGRPLADHSAQWTWPIQTSRPYYQQVLTSFQIEPAP